MRTLASGKLSTGRAHWPPLCVVPLLLFSVLAAQSQARDASQAGSTCQLYTLHASETDNSQAPQPSRADNTPVLAPGVPIVVNPAPTPSKVIEISDVESWQTLTTSKNFIDWFPFYHDIGLQMRNQWSRFAEQRAGTRGDTKITFTIDNKGTITVEPWCSKALEQANLEQVQEMVSKLKPPPFPAGTVQTLVSVEYRLTYNGGGSGTIIWSYHRWGEVDGKLYRLTKDPEVDNPAAPVRF